MGKSATEIALPSQLSILHSKTLFGDHFLVCFALEYNLSTRHRQVYSLATQT